MAAGAVLTTNGKGLLTAAMVAANLAQFIGWGTGSGTAAVTDTALFTEVVDTARSTAAVSAVTTAVTNDTYQILGTLTATAARAITEIATFSALTAGTIFNHITFSSAYPLNTGDSVTWKIQTQFQ